MACWWQKEDSIEGHGGEKREEKSSAEAHGPVHGAIASAQSFTYSKRRDCLHVRCPEIRPGNGDVAPERPFRRLIMIARCKYFAAERQNSWQWAITLKLRICLQCYCAVLLGCRREGKLMLHMRSKVQYRIGYEESRRLAWHGMAASHTYLVSMIVSTS